MLKPVSKPSNNTEREPTALDKSPSRVYYKVWNSVTHLGVTTMKNLLLATIAIGSVGIFASPASAYCSSGDYYGRGAQCTPPSANETRQMENGTYNRYPSYGTSNYGYSPYPYGA